MCIIVYKPSGVAISRETLQQCWESNDDGAGFMYAHEGKIVIEKGFFDFEEFMAFYEDHLENEAQDADMVLHFRIATHGVIDEANCHPHTIPGHPRLAFAHNGMLSGVDVPKKSDKSDTMIFAEEILGPLPKTWLKNEAIVRLVEDFIGRGNKLVFMDHKGNVTILNEELGVWDKGIWYSNKTYKISRWAKKKASASFATGSTIQTTSSAGLSKAPTSGVSWKPSEYFGHNDRRGNYWDDEWDEWNREWEYMKQAEDDAKAAFYAEQDETDSFDSINEAAIDEVELEIQKALEEELKRIDMEEKKKLREESKKKSQNRKKERLFKTSFFGL